MSLSHYDLATKLAEILLRDKTDKAGLSALSHAVRVADRMATYGEATVAMLHDLIEDTQLTIADLDEMGFPGDIVASVDAVSRRAGELYFEYIRRVKLDKVAAKVKLADIEDHLRPIPGFVIPDSLVTRYRTAKSILKS